MAVTVGVPRETFPGERRVAITPRHCDALAKLGASVIVERSAGVQAGFPDDQYSARGARLASRAEVFQAADVIVQVRTLGANPEAGRADLSLLRYGQTVIGFGEPLTAAKECSDLAAAGVSFLAMELMPRITRAQSLDALSSMATISGYAAVPGKKAPVLITAAMTGAMAPGSVIVDIVAERGGNCELTRAGETIVHKGVTILGPLNLPSMMPYHASQMFASNVTAFLKLMVRDGALDLNLDDEIIRETLVTHGNHIVHPRVRESLGVNS